MSLQAQLAHAQRQSVAAIADERRLHIAVTRAADNAASWEHRAALALRAGDETLARQALHRKAQWNAEATTLGEQWTGQRQAVDALRQSLTALGQRIADAHRQRNALVARTAAAHAKLAVAQTMAHLDALSPASALAHIEDRVMQLEAYADANTELHGLGGDPLEAQFAALERGAVDDDLAALKARMGLGPLALPR